MSRIRMRRVMGELSSRYSDGTREGRPVLDKTQVIDLSKRVMSMTSADTVTIYVTHTARAVTRIAGSEVRSNDDGDELEVSIITKYGQRASVGVATNQLTESTLRAVVERCEALAREQMGGGGTPIPTGPQVADTYLPVTLWHDTTVEGMTQAREHVVPLVIDGITKHGLSASGFAGLMARARAVLTKEGISAYGEETDSEITMTARAQDGTGVSTGWAGQAVRDWSTIDYHKVAEDAAHMALQGRGARALEPGRRTAILSPTAVVQMVRYFAQELDAYMTDLGGTGFSKPGRGGGNRIGQRMFDPRIQMVSDPQDPEGGYMPFFSTGFATPRMTWVENGVLKNLSYNPSYAVSRGKPYAETPYSIRVDTGPRGRADPTPTIEDMISQCEEGIYVNRLSDVNLLDLRTGMMTGVTNGGCFFVKHGKIDRPVKNFRILDSPFVFLNNVLLIGNAIRAAFGYAPPGKHEYTWDKTYAWPRRPVIVPPMMVRDFNFNVLADAV